MFLDYEFVKKYLIILLSLFNNISKYTNMKEKEKITR